MKRAKLTTFAIAFAVLFAFTSPASAAWKEKVLYSFQGLTDGSTPVGGVVFDSAGNLYGATRDGGSATCQSIYQCGTVYQLAPPTKEGGPWTETVLYVFQGNAKNDGASPFGGLVMDSAGNLYGTTAYGGTGNCVLLGSKVGCGAVYELSPPANKGSKWTEKILYSFPSSKYGYVPRGSLVFDGAGNLYGATIFGGGHGTTCDPFYQFCGAVFELSPPTKKGGKWTGKILHGFRGGADGAEPNGGLILDSKGVIYGTTYFGGSEKNECNGGSGGTGCGTVFALTPPTIKGGAWTEKVLHRFNSQDGANPAAGGIFDNEGDLYGTTYAGGVAGNGLVFSLTAPTAHRAYWKENVLHYFNGRTYQPIAGVIFGSTDTLYGAASSGGTHRGGSLFQLERGGGRWTYTVAHEFSGSPNDGAYADASLARSNSGSVGTTQLGGTGSSCQAGCGTVFQIIP